MESLLDFNTALNNHTHSWKDEFFAFPHLPWWGYLMNMGISATLVCFAGLCSGLTLGLLSIDPMSLSILMQVGTEREKIYARRLEPILSRHHLLLVTLLLWNAMSMEALPLFLDRMLPEFLAIGLSVTFVLIFGEVLPQAVISRFGLAIGGNLAWFVKILMFFAFPVAWPVSKLLDFILGGHHATYLKRAEFKELVNIHAIGKGEGGILSPDEINVIRGTLELKEKRVESITTPLNRVYMLPMEGTLDMNTMHDIVKNGHSRVPVFRNGNREDICGVILVKSLITVNPEDRVPISDLQIREIHSIVDTAMLWDVLNMFQSGKSHIAVVKRESENTSIGIVTLEDVFEELIQEEIIDETDVFVDMQRQVRVADVFRRINTTPNRTSFLNSLYSQSKGYGSIVGSPKPSSRLSTPQDEEESSKLLP